MEKQITANLFDVGCISIFGANGAESRWDSFSTDRSRAQTCGLGPERPVPARMEGRRRNNSWRAKRLR